MFGGDEVGAIVVDIGSSNIKCGYAGEGFPRSIFPTVIASSYIDNDGNRSQQQTDGKLERHVGADALYRRDHTELTSPLQHGLVTNWDGVECVWEHIFKKQLRIDPKEQPIMLADPVFNAPIRRQKMVELLFEKFEVPGIYLGRSAVLASFSLGKTTAIVLDCGGDVTTVCPVHEGFVLNRGIRKTKISGNYLDNQLMNLLFKEHKLIPRYEVNPIFDGQKHHYNMKEYPNTSLSFRKYMCLDIVRDIKETLARVTEVPFKLTSRVPLVEYQLPTGEELKVGGERFEICETLFSKDDIQNDLDSHRGFIFEGVDKMIRTSINACDVDMQRDLYSNIIPVGGTSLLNGFQERLFKDLNNDNPPALKAKIHTSNLKAERQCAVWIGGSILGSLGSFHQMWLSRAEYEDQGADSIIRKCP